MSSVARPHKRRHQQGGPVRTPQPRQGDDQQHHDDDHLSDDLHGHAYGYYASRWAREATNGCFPRVGEPPAFVKQRIDSYRLLDFKPQLNTASYVNVVAEPEETEIARDGLAINIADQTIYPGSFQMHNDCLNLVADLWHCPRDEAAPAGEKYVAPGACTVGSTEACLLAGLALKFRWRAWFAARHGKTEAQVRREYPNLVISTLYQAAWEKLFKYCDVEPRFVPCTRGSFQIDPTKVADAVDEHTIGVVCILGNHYSGHYDDVLAVSKVVDDLNQRNGWQLGIHVDAASGGFCAPFQSQQPLWDFRISSVLSVSASGHKFGLSCCGTGWVVWRQRRDLSEHVAISVSYLGGNADSYTLNFSRPASGVSVQMYKFLRLGREGYTRLVDNVMATASYIRAGLANMRDDDGRPLFEILDAGDDKPCLPVVTARLNKDLGYAFNDIDLQHALAERHWYVGGYKMSFRHPETEIEEPLFVDEPAESTMFRVVVKVNLTRNLAHDLIDAMHGAFHFLKEHGAGFASMHRHASSKARGKIHKQGISKNPPC